MTSPPLGTTLPSMRSAWPANVAHLLWHRRLARLYLASATTAEAEAFRVSREESTEALLAFAVAVRPYCAPHPTEWPVVITTGQELAELSLDPLFPLADVVHLLHELEAVAPGVAVTVPRRLRGLRGGRRGAE